MNVFEKIEALQGEERGPAWMVGEQLKDIIKNNERAQEIVSQDLDVPEMSLVECEKKIKAFADKKKIKAFADKKKTGNFSCVLPCEAEEIIKEFYGITNVADGISDAPLTLDSFFG